MNDHDGWDCRGLAAQGGRTRKRWLVPVCMCSTRFPRLVFAVLLALALTSFLAMTTAPLQAEKSLHRSPSLNHVSNTCQCQSLFTIGACDMESTYTGKHVSVAWRNALQKLEKARTGQPISITQQLHELSRFLPSVFNIPEISTQLVKTKDEKLYPFLSNHSQMVLNASDFQHEPDIKDLRRRMSSFDHVPCAIHSYTKSDIKTCLQKRQKIAGKPLNIAFVGDSQVRNVMEQIVWHLEKTLNLKSGDEKVSNLVEDFLDLKTKIDLPVTGDGIKLCMHWATFLGRNRTELITNQGAKDLLFDWARNQSSERGEEVPDILYFDDGLWSALTETNVASFALVMNDFVQLLPAFRNISKTTRLILRTQTHFKEFAALRQRSSSIMDLLNQIGWVVLHKAGVWVWDTITPHYLKEFDECRNHWRTGMGRYLPRSWKCHDSQHPSKISERTAANMIWNYVCNDIMNYDQSHCCTN